MSSTAFSYAQAAKRQIVSQPSPQLTSSTAPPSTSSQAKDDILTANTSVTASSVTSNDAEAPDGDKTTQPDVDVALSRQNSELGSLRVSVPSTTMAVAERLTKSDTAVESLDHAEDKSTSSASRTSRTNDNVYDKKGRKTKKSRGSDRDSQSEQALEDEKEKEIPKPVFSEAPLPAVNVWARRIEAQQAAKAKLAPAAVPSVGPAVATNTDTKKRDTAEEADAHSSALNRAVNGDKMSRKTPELPRPTEQAQRRAAPRGSRANDKDERGSVALPPVADASLWPDPKSAAATTDELSRKSQDKPETTENHSQDDAGQAKKKTWVNLEIIPNVIWQTPMPPRGTKPRGGARGGREQVSARPNQGSVTSPTNASTPGPVNDKSTPAGVSVVTKAAVPRPREGSIPARAASQGAPPHASKRASIDGASSRDQRKMSVTANTEQARESGTDSSVFPVKKGTVSRENRHDVGPVNSEPGHGIPRALHQDRPNNFHPRGLEFAKEGPQSAIGVQQYPVREARSERVSRGGYRARGGHNGATGPHSASSTYGPNGQYSAHSPYQPRQTPAAHSPPPYSGQFPVSFVPQGRGRGNKWATSGQSSGRNGSTGGAFPPKPQVNEFPVTQYAPYSFYHPYDQTLLVAKSQVEYYLSVENLCKDFYLRKRMDGQGFVPLSVIAGFKRMQSLAKDSWAALDLIRAASSYSEVLEYVIGDDNIERLRLREKWNAFVLPEHERVQEAQNNGPANFAPVNRQQATPLSTTYPGPLMPQAYPATPSSVLYSGYPDEQMFQAPDYMNGAQFEPAMNGGDVNGHRYVSETQLSAGVAEWSPPTLESLSNFTDAQVEKLMMILDYNEKDGSDSPEAAGVAGYVSDGPHHGLNGVSASTTEAPVVNGGTPNGTANTQSSAQSTQTAVEVVWIDEQRAGNTTKNTERQPYTQIRQAALDQRRNAVPGETPREMQKLYEFWSRLLLKDFNAKIYEEFKELALADASAPVPTKYGLKYLIKFYDNLLNGGAQKPWPQGQATPAILKVHYNEALGRAQGVLN
ncbi:hypothetical protein B0T24DRAFT_66302 [Lasiosphaeria ovina]|uniref:HTH La-type RNA-binding domain-containing protein n=1 Tax=Lasiosphaeria ovina TaxID=92902 RepID=A0AAE0NLW2_9PEZI|nr:hypothetical protein B0T24DRAFT_66302 [Lasiosphaeria ovina]